ncbi:MAG: WYL domain-containing protein [Thiobacillus sp.]|nr:WYL domain-containing protein [Thiobacillus sp.]
MSKLDELYRLHRLLDGRRTGLPRSVLIDEHGFSRSSLTRLIADLRDRLDAPLIHDRERGGYRYDTADGSHALPGLWFTPAELHALFTLKHLLANLAPGLLDDHLRPLQARLDKLLESQHLGAGEAAQRIRLLSIASRRKNPRHFQTVAHAVLQRHRIRIDYYNDKKGLRIFAVECIRTATPLGKAAKTVTESTLNRELASAYGIFAGLPVATAVLRFTPKRARWVADEIWHPQQQSRWLEDGRYELAVPYSDDRELLMDILKYGAEVEIVAPETLREAVRNQLDAASGQYRRGNATGSVFEHGD